MSRDVARRIYGLMNSPLSFDEKKAALRVAEGQPVESVLAGVEPGRRDYFISAVAPLIVGRTRPGRSALPTEIPAPEAR